MTAPLKHDGRVNSVRFSSDGKRLVTACLDSTARIWDSDTGHSVREPLRHPARVMYAEFSPDGQWVVTASDDGTAKIWEVPMLSSSMSPWLSDWAEAVAGQRIDERNANQSVSFDKLSRLRQSLAQAPDGDEASRWANWFFTENTTRKISPASLLTVAQLVEQRTEESTLDSLQQAVRLSPTNGLAQARLGYEALANEAEPNPRLIGSSEWQNRRELELSPNEPDAWRARAQFCEHRGRLAEALDAMDRGIGLSPAKASFWNSKGLLLEKTDRLEKSLQSYTKAIELSGPWKDQQTLPALANANRSKLYRRLKRLAEAGMDRLKALHLPQRDPGTPATLLDLSLFYNDGMNTVVSSDTNHNFTTLPLGRQTLLGGREFESKGVISLWLEEAGATSEQVLDIPIAQKRRRLHFLHSNVAAAGNGRTPPAFVIVTSWLAKYIRSPRQRVYWSIRRSPRRVHSLEVLSSPS
jgi:tetratricopeptide (TPR) repeat protein